MAQTYYIADGLNAIQRLIPRQAEEDMSATIANMAINTIWMKYDWRESMADLPPFYAIPNVQDYAPPFYNIPVNFLGIREAYIVNTATVPPFRKPLHVVKDLPREFVRDFPHSIGYVSASRSIRLHPRIPPNIAANAWIIDGTYKIKPPRVTYSSLNSVYVPWDDMYIQVFIAALRWAAYNVAGDQRAGQVQYTADGCAYSGALAEMHAQIDEMAANEGINLGDPVIAPAESLTGAGYFGGYTAYPGSLAY